MKRIRKLISLMLAVMMVFGIMAVAPLHASAAAGIANNGLGGIYIDINAAPYNDGRWYAYGNPYGSRGCTWFVGARVMQLTGKGSYNTQDPAAWYDWYGPSLGFSRGSTPQARSVIVYKGHVAFLEKIEGNTAYVSEGGLSQYKHDGNWKNWANGNSYTAIHRIGVNEIANGCGYRSDFVGYVYLGAPPQPPKPNAPASVSIGKSDIGIGDSLTATWSASSGATSYNVSLTCTTNSAYNKTTKVNGTSASFLINNAGTYRVSVSASNSSGTSSAVTSSNCVAHNNVIVRYVDWNDELIGSEQSVKYGGNAVVPVAPEREGYTFQHWSSDGKNLKQDMTIKAEYKINTYTVTFIDYNGDNIGNVQRIEYCSAAVPPTDIPTKPGYVFAGWSTEDYKCVKRSMTVQATYVWENVDLPSILSVASAVRNEEATGYSVKVNLTNFPNDFTKGKLVVALKTKEGKMVASETRSVSMPSEQEYTENVMVLYSGIVSTVEVSLVGVIDDNTTGTPKAKSVIAPIDIGNEWSDWSVNVPEGDEILTESRTEYRYKDYKTIKATSQPATPAGYIYIGADPTATYTDWGAWSTWSRNNPGGNTPLRQVESSYHGAVTHTEWNYSRYTNGAGWCGPWAGYWSGNYCGNYQERGWGGQLGIKEWQTAGGKTFAIYDGGGGATWFNEWTRPVTDVAEYTDYRYRTRQEYYNYRYVQADFSDWQPEAVEESATRDVETRTTYRFKTNSTEVPCYNYKRYKYTNLNNGKMVYAYSSAYPDSMDYPGEWEYNKTFSPLELYATVDGDIELYNGIGEDSWYKADLNNESESTVFETASTLEDTAGVSRHLEGTLNDATDKVVTLIVYKGQNEDPTASQIEYIGQTTADADGFYSFDYITREEPSVKTGDFVITVGIEGSTNYMNVGRIEAPKPVYVVDFIAQDGSLISEVNVVAGGTAEAPKAPEVDGYEFIGWDTGLKNISENMVVSPIYRKLTYTVIFVDWDNTSIDVKSYSYGDTLSLDALPERTGMEFSKWVDADGKEVTTVTKNMIVTASYSDAQYVITFTDWEGNTVSEQVLSYGESADIPDDLAAPNDKQKFQTWNGLEYAQYVTQDKVIAPVATYLKTSSAPSFTIQSGTYPESQSVGIYSLKANTEIYYKVVDKNNLKETIYIEDGEFHEYEDELELDGNSIVYAYAVTKDSNPSKIVEVNVDIKGEDDPSQISGIVDGYYYENGELAKGLGLVEYEGDIYFVKNDGSIYKNGSLRVLEAKTNGILAAGLYNFDAEGKLVTSSNGIVNGYYYKNGELAKGAGVVEVDGNFYFVKNNGALYTFGRLSIVAAKTNGLLPAASYNIDENGKILCNGVINGYFYIDGDKAKGAGVVEYGGNLYFAKNDGTVYKNGRLSVSEAKTNGLVAAGAYNFDENGKMQEVERIYKGYYYLNGKKVPGAGLVEYNGDLYFIKNNAAVYTSGYLYVTKAKANDLVSEGRYQFDGTGKMIR